MNSRDRYKDALARKKAIAVSRIHDRYRKRLAYRQVLLVARKTHRSRLMQFWTMVLVCLALAIWIKSPIGQAIPVDHRPVPGLLLLGALGYAYFLWKKLGW